ncbi:MAG: ABC transporter substrate-binding protein, partial [Deltaproteobacteria bacterium]
VTLIKQGWNVDPLLQKQAHCVSTMSYNEYWQVIDAGLSPADLVVFKYDGEGVAVLEDGLYVMENRLNDANFVNRLARFLRASMKGWEYAGNNPDEAADIVLENDDTGAQTEKHQRRMMREINKLVANADQPNGIGYLDPSDYNRSVGVLLASGDAVISKPPKGAWTHKVYEAMTNL